MHDSGSFHEFHSIPSSSATATVLLTDRPRQPNYPQTNSNVTTPESGLLRSCNHSVCEEARFKLVLVVPSIILSREANEVSDDDDDWPPEERKLETKGNKRREIGRERSLLKETLCAVVAERKKSRRSSAPYCFRRERADRVPRAMLLGFHADSNAALDPANVRIIKKY